MPSALHLIPRDQRLTLARRRRAVITHTGGGMPLDFPATGQALWTLFDKGGPRPEYVLPVLYSESGFSTSVTNSIGCIGLNQLCPFAWPIPAGYASWSASQQIAGPITSMFLANNAKFGALNSGTRCYQSNFLPATLPCKSLDAVLATQAGGGECWTVSAGTSRSIYAANPGLDYQKTGAIRVSDLAHFIAKAAAAPLVQQAIAQTYAVRPNEKPLDPVYGTDFNTVTPSGWLGSALLALLGFGIGAGGAYLADR